jgi:predicted transcriptional regulator
VTKTAQKIADIVEVLSPDAQAALLDMAEALAHGRSFYETMTGEQRAELELAIADLDAGRLASLDEVDAELDALLARKS